jgi:phosphoribosylglycinamide formyltransferase 1
LRHKGTNKKWNSPTNLSEKCNILHKKTNSVQGKPQFKGNRIPIRLAILASGSGSNAENIIHFFSSENRVDIGIIISNRAVAQVHQRAKRLGIPSVTFSRETLTDGLALVQILKNERVDFIVLAGYLLKIPAELIAAFPNRMVNIHPALLPKFGGKGMYGDHVHQAVVDAKEQESGITIHLVNENYDEGCIVFQAKCPVFPGDSAADVAAKVHELEHRYYPEIIGQLLQKEFNW